MGKRRALTVVVAVLAGLALLLAFHWRPDIPVEKLLEEYAGENSRFVEIDGLKVHYRDEGSGEPVVLLHGVLSSLHTWDGWTAELQRERRVIRLDLPGFGLTGPGTEPQINLDYYVEFMAKFLDALGLERVTMAGNSMGGGITWLFAARYPERVDKIVLLDAAGFLTADDNLNLFKLAGSPVLKPLVRYCTPPLPGLGFCKAGLRRPWPAGGGYHYPLLPPPAAGRKPGCPYLLRQSCRLPLRCRRPGGSRFH